MTIFFSAIALTFLAPIPFLFINSALAQHRPWLATAVLVAIAISIIKHIKFSDLVDKKISTQLTASIFASALVLFIADNVFNYLAFKLNGVDFSIFDRMLFNTANGRIMWSALCNCNHLSVHQSWILFPLVPVHNLFSSPWFLIALHPMIVWSGAWPLWRLANKNLPSQFLALLTVIAYLANPWTGSINSYGFHMEAFFLPAGLWFLYGWSENKRWIWISSVIVFLSVKEDAAFYISGFAAYSIWKEKDKRSAAMLVLLFSVSTLVINLLIVAPLIRPIDAKPTFFSFWSQYGSTIPEITATMLSSPHKVLFDILTSQWYLIFASALFLPLLSLHAVFAMLPAIIILGTSGSSAMRNYGLYYSAPILPFFFWGLLLAFRKLETFFGMQRAGLIFATALIIIPFTRNGTITLERPKFDQIRELDQSVQEHRNYNDPVCAQLSLVPHLPYEWDVRPLSKDCNALPNAAILGHLELPSFPYDRPTLSVLLRADEGENTGLIAKYMTK